MDDFTICTLHFYYLFSCGITRLCNHAGLIENSCETRKQDNHTLIDFDSGGADVIESRVIVLNPVNDSVCNLQCAVGWYHLEYGNAAPFSCAPQTADRTSREGIPTYPITCTGAYIIPTYCIQYSVFIFQVYLIE